MLRSVATGPQAAPPVAHRSVTFRPPALPATSLARPRLERLLGPTVAPRLSLVTGPPGSGKTTLVRQWLAGAPYPWSWIDVDATIDHPRGFWGAVIRAVQMAAPAQTLDAVDQIGVHEADGQELVEQLAQDLDHHPDGDRPVVVVVDDAHRLDARCWDQLAWLLAHQPPGLHLVAISRSEPPFSLARPRAAGWVTEVRGEQLALVERETLALLRRCAADADLADADWLVLGSELHRRTEGWVAGLRLAVLALVRGRAPAELLERFTERRSMVSELLVAEALDHQPPAIRSFLRRTSVSGVLEPELCDVLTGRTDSADVLRQLASDHVFVTPLEGDDDQYRYHPLLAELLRSEVRTEGDQVLADLHHQAARWYVGRGRWAEAIEQSRAGELHGLTLELITDHLPELYRQGHRSEVARWLLDIPELFVVRDPKRAVDQCAALLFVTRREWRRWLRLARSVVGPEHPDLLARIALFDGLAEAGQGHCEGFERCCEASVALRSPALREPFDEVALAWRIRLLTLAGDHDLAVGSARGLVERERLLIGDLAAVGLLAATLDAAGAGDGTDLADQVVVSWRALGEPDVLGMADALCVASAAALRRGDLLEAEHLAVSATAMTAEPPSHLLTVRSQIAAAEVDATLGRRDEAEGRLRRLRAELVRNHAAPAVLSLLDRAATRSPAPAHAARQATGPLLEPLTERERTILGYLAGHRTLPEIGQELYISRHTVKTHVSRIYRKLGVTSRSGAVEAAEAHGL